MINRSARDQAAALVDQYRAAEITNRQLERDWPDDQGDRGVMAVDHFVWTLHDDFKEHKITPEVPRNGQNNHLLKKCIAFLKSEEDYGYPFFSYLDVEYFPSWAVWASLGLLGLLNARSKRREDRYWREMRAAGDIAAWPSTESSSTTETAETGSRSKGPS